MMMMKRNLEVEENQGTINALADTRRVTATSLKNQVTKRTMAVRKRKTIATEIIERTRKKSLTKISGITKPNSTDVEPIKIRLFYSSSK